jgi:hypothetical protein
VPDENRSIKITGGEFSKSAVAAGDIRQTFVKRSRVDNADLLAELRAELRSHRAELIRLAGAKGSRVARNLDEIDEEIAELEPNAQAVRNGWETVTRLVTGAGGAAESLTKIAELVRSLFGQ